MTEEGKYSRQGEDFKPRGYYVVFDGPPSDPGRFVEVEDEYGASVSAAEWSTNGSLWYLGPLHDLRRVPGYAMLIERDRQQREQIGALQTQVRAEADAHRKWHDRALHAEERARYAEQSTGSLETKLVGVEEERDALAEENLDMQRRLEEKAEAHNRATNLQQEAEERANDERKRAQVFHQERDEARLRMPEQSHETLRRYEAMRDARDNLAAQVTDLENYRADAERRAKALGDKVHELMEKLAHAEDRAHEAEQQAQVHRQDADAVREEREQAQNEVKRLADELRASERERGEAEKRTHRLWIRAIRAEDGKGAAEQRLRRSQERLNATAESLRLATQQLYGFADGWDMRARREGRIAANILTSSARAIREVADDANRSE